MWWLLVKTFVQALAMIVIGELLRPRAKTENPKPTSLGDFNFPTAQEGRNIPCGWGTLKISGPNVTWFGDLKVEPIKQKQKTGLFSSTKVVVGFKYFLGVQHALLHGAIDEFIKIIIDDKDVPVTGLSVTADVTSFTMNAKTLFGKEKEQGGVSGPVKVYHGTFTQTQNQYLRAVLGKTEIPAYRPICHVIFEQCYLGNSGNIQPPEFIVRRTPNPLALTGGAHNIDGDANPANMVYEILTDRTWGMGISAALIDVADFQAVGQTLAGVDERLGLSMLVDNVQSGDALIAEIMRHIDGVLYQDFATGLFRIALVRDDYDAETAPVFNETNIVPNSLEFGRSSWEDTQNTVMVKYLDRAQNYTQRVVQHQNLANISARGGQIEAEEYDFLGVSNPTAANTIAARVLKTVSSPLSKVNFSANRSATVLRPGSVFKLEWPKLGIASVIYRVTELDLGTLESPTIRVTAVEDIFSIPSVAYTAPQPSGWVRPTDEPVPLVAQKLLEAPRAFYGDSRVVMTLGVRAGGQELGYLVYSDPAGGTAYTETNDVTSTTPSGLLTADYGASTHALDATGFTIENTDGLIDFEAITAQQRAQGEFLLLIDDEFLAATDVVDNLNGTYTVTGVQQGVLDTLPTRHLAGARVWFVTEGYGTTALDPYASLVTVRAKLLPYTLRATLDLADAASTLLTVVDRAVKPYPPSNLRVNGAYFLDAVITGASTLLTLAWNHRDRTQQVDDVAVLQQNAASIGPEAATTYTLKLYDQNGILRRTEAGLTVNTYTWTAETTDSQLSGDIAVVNFTGADGSTTIVDDAGSTWTASGGAQMLSGSMEFDGTNDFVATPDAANWQLSGAFTLEVFDIVFDSLATTQSIAAQWDAFSPFSNNRGWYWQVGTDGRIALTYSTDGSSTTVRTAAVASITAGVPYNLAISRDLDNNLYFFVNGVLTDTFAAQSWVTFNANSPLSLGAISTQGSSPTSNYFDGRLKAFRFTRDEARYTANYTPDTLPLVFTPYALNSAGRIMLETFRDGVQSFQTYDFNWTRPDATPPIFALNTEADDILITESDNTIILE